MRLVPAVAALVAATAVGAGAAEPLEKERRRGAEVLRDVAALLGRRYHDPAFAGHALSARVARAEEEMRRAGSEAATFGVVAGLLAGLGDSHTFLVPPAQAGALDYGWTPRMVGERCFVVDVRPGTDAHHQRLHAGDEVLALEGRLPTRDTVWRTLHLARFSGPEPSVRLRLRRPDGVEREVTVSTQAAPRGRTVSFHEYLGSLRHRLKGRAGSRFAEVDGVLVWKLAAFHDAGRALSAGVARARPKRALVLDLRGNGGGDLDALRRFAGGFFARTEDLTLGWLHGRRRRQALRASRWATGRTYDGPLVIVVDSESASAAEVFARTVQLRGRGLVIGDRTGGAVMLSRIHVLLQNRDSRFVPYAVSVSEARVEMADGARLEGRGLVPDELALPAPEDLRDGRDPVLARALALAGARLDPAEAGALFTRAERAAR
jgi:carboxyl-terminal processing protease